MNKLILYMNVFIKNQKKDDAIHLNTYDCIIIKNVTKISEKLLDIDLLCVGCLIEDHDISDLRKNIKISIDKLNFWELGL